MENMRFAAVAVFDLGHGFDSDNMCENARGKKLTSSVLRCSKHLHKNISGNFSQFGLMRRKRR